ncbi:dephospho-CoA kinase [Capnocytophaga sp. oral taxon 878]|uniref:dephospho-CoA kinase n=1 Tax=Capnocytophaga sp. oral taxon 878 TaxID=1316596 RepID=UPI000D044E06|nr:dephospho-CoA kinase [Capnocytophaga sp. oral taxon 878]AVM51328.1 dephospho-CoA kinase [Capnocytophaga sp. oral taxon 878]
MKIVGLTGGIGSGKTTVAAMFAQLGVAVFNSDEQAKNLIATNKQVKQQIIATFGAQSYTSDGYNRSYIAQIVFHNPDKLAQLNAIVHPALAQHFHQWVLQQQGVYVLKEAAILFESGSYKDCDYIITVTAPQQLRIARAMSRDGSTLQQIKARISHQWTDARRIALSQAVIHNTDLADTQKQVQALHQYLIQLFAPH